MLVLFIAVSVAVIYLIWGLAIINGLNLYVRRRPKSPYKELKQISIVVAFRNEEQHLPKLLDSITSLNYPKEFFEVVFIDDHSEDGGPDLIKNWLQHVSIKGKCMKMEQPKSGKKEAQANAIAAARNNIIACTDADCELPNNWLQAVNHSFSNDSIALAFGPVTIDGKVHPKQKLEFDALIASTMAMLRLQWPVMGNGANMAFKKEVFEQQQGKLASVKSASGDDVFLLQQVARSGGKIGTLEAKNGLVKTSAQEGIKNLFQQRLRWASKAKYYKSYMPILVGLLVFAMNATLLFLFIFSLFSLNAFYLFAFVLTVKALTDFVILKKYTNHINQPFAVFDFVLQEFINIIYVPAVAIFSQVLPYWWKGRRY